MKETFLKTLRERDFVIVWLVLAALTLIVILLGIFNVRPSDLQVPTRYSAFGITNFYRDKWYYAISFIVFALAMVAMHSMISLKLYVAKDRRIALAFLWLSVLMMVITIATLFAIFRLIALGQ